MIKKPWTDGELGFIHDTMDWPVDEVVAHLGRSYLAVTSKRNRRNLKPVTRKDLWSDAENDVLLTSSHLSAPQIAKLLPRRSVMAIRSQRDNLSLFAEKPWQVGRRRLVAKTCPACGKLLSARWFESKNNQWRTICVRCFNVRAKDCNAISKIKRSRNNASSYKRLQDASLKVADPDKRGSEWMDSEYEIIARSDLTVFQKALAVKRSYYATGQKVSTMGFKSLSGLGEQTDVWVIQLPGDVA